MRFPLRRIVLGFAVGAGAGWVASLLRRPKDAPAGSSAEAAINLPQEEFGKPEGGEPDAPAPHEPPRKAVPEMITTPPGREDPPPPHGDTGGDAEPATPTRRRRPRKVADPGEAAAAVAEPVSEAVREGRAEVAERLAGIEESVAPPATTRRRKR